MATTDVYDSIGRLIVRTVTAGGALPLEGVQVTVLGGDPQNQNISLGLLTDQSGNTEAIDLPAPSAALSRSPGNLAPFATYHLIAEKEGYYLHEALQLPVFSGITSVQTLEMIPKGYRNGEETVPKVVRMIEETEPFAPRNGG